ncbi:MAG: hypothetical protein GY727_10560 [Gammaproteobacteria bacterium]|nr:hypothetical protein [Gammaproteobacteria bacterium]MCP4088538.1 hypothetical protein [Gammaproteobacteria bacterium]MCP4276722.1 hypothetical protein [Gammaproteobacteria bacterium]MCP4832431.1 hypothetical protein [Gammaproteobacteria bacterium]MCP4929872.1 hypothetical protein [Gammaproteobacteria bacterium]
MTRSAIVAILFLVFGLLIIGGWWQPFAPAFPDRQPLATQRPNLNLQLSAYRGASLDAPENTIPAIEAAIKRGAAWVELDVRYTSDGVPVLFHDADVSRTTNGTGLLEYFSLQELQTLDAGSWFNESFAGTRVPTLEEALEILQGKVCVYWDAKGLPAQRAVELFQQYGFERNCLVVNIYNEWDNILHLLWPDAPLIHVAGHLDQLPVLINNQPWLAAVRLTPQQLNEPLVNAAHTRGLKVFVRVKETGDAALTYINYAAAGGADVITLADLDVFNEWRVSQQESVDGQIDVVIQPEALIRP